MRGEGYNNNNHRYLIYSDLRNNNRDNLVLVDWLKSAGVLVAFVGGLFLLQALLTSLEKASKILDKPIEKINTESALHIDTIDIDINKLSFRYAEETRFVLNDISLNTKQGEKIAVVGTKGSGKSTLLHLLTGTFLNYDGAITINNLPLFSYDLHKLRSKIGIYFSESEIFEGTLEENLIVGLADCDVNDIIHLAEQIGLKEFITKNRDGIYQVLSTHGKKLSESTKAKILLARAILKKPKLLLLDDFTYLLTKRDKNTIIDFLFNSNQQYSIFIKTSDEEIMKRCDRILLMHEGKIVADGLFQEITSSNEYKLISDDLYELH